MGKNDQELTKEEIEKCKCDTVVMENEDCIMQTFEDSKKKEVN